MIPRTEFEPAVPVFGEWKTLSVMGSGATVNGIEKIRRINVRNLSICH